MARRLLAGCLAGVLAQSVVGLKMPPGYLEESESVHSPISREVLNKMPPGYLKELESVHSPIARELLNKMPPGYLEESESVRSSTSREVSDRADAAGSGRRVLEDAFYALAVLQNSYFDAVNGTWPSSIDWTGAVIETVVSGMLTTLTQSLSSNDFGGDASWSQKENLISSVYAQVVHSFFGQNALAIKDQVSVPRIHQDGTILTS